MRKIVGGTAVLFEVGTAIPFILPDERKTRANVLMLRRRTARGYMGT